MLAESVYAKKTNFFGKNKSQGALGNNKSNLIIRKIDRAKMKKISKIIGDQQ